jgi:hypothetical protein
VLCGARGIRSWLSYASECIDEAAGWEQPRRRGGVGQDPQQPVRRPCILDGALGVDDEACGHYDADESCADLSGNPDLACGMTTIDWWPDTQDTDDNCGEQLTGGGTDPDNSDDVNDGPVNPRSNTQ